MSNDRVFDEPSEVTAEDGVISVHGPDGVKVLLTPSAADETSDRLLHAAMEGRGQTRIAKGRRRNDLAQ